MWIIENQLERRNLTKEAKIRLENKRKDILSEEAEKRMKAGKKAELDARFLEALDNNENKGVDPSANLHRGSEYGKVAEHIAESAGTSPRTVYMFNYIEKHDPKRADALCRGNYDEDGKRITTNSVYKDLKEKAQELC